VTTRRFTTRSGHVLVADTYGADDAPPVLLTHGGGQTRHAWNRTGERLAEAGYRVINLDLRGHGESDWSKAGDYSLDGFIADVEDVLAQITTGPIALVGASLGGMISLVATGEAAAHTTRLVLVDVVPRVEPAGAQRIVDFMLAHSDGFASLEEAADAVAAYIPERPRPKSNAGLEKNLRLRDGRLHWHWDPALLGPGGLRGSNAEVRLELAAATVSCPTLLVRGVLSDVVSPEGVERLRVLIPHLDLCDVAEAGHMVAGDRNDVFASAVVDFLSAPCPQAAPHAGR